MYNVSKVGLVGQPLHALVDPSPEPVLELGHLLPLGLRRALAHQLHEVAQLERRVLGIVVEHLGQQEGLLLHRDVGLDELGPCSLQLVVDLLGRVKPHLPQGEFRGKILHEDKGVGNGSKGLRCRGAYGRV